MPGICYTAVAARKEKRTSGKEKSRQVRQVCPRQTLKGRLVPWRGLGAGALFF